MLGCAVDANVLCHEHTNQQSKLPMHCLYNCEICLVGLAEAQKLSQVLAIEPPFRLLSFLT